MPRELLMRTDNFWNFFRKKFSLEKKIYSFFTLINFCIFVQVENPENQPEPCEIHFNKDRNLTYSCSYTPKMEGTHKVSVKFSGREVPKSPFSVKVEGHPGDASKVTAYGPGLQPDGVCISRSTYFDISTKGIK